MNKDRVSDIARAHKHLEKLRLVPQDAAIQTVRRNEEMAHARELWNELGRECTEYCAYYNAAMGAARIFCEIHDDTIVIRSHLDPQNTVTLSRTPGTFHEGMLAAHRYHYPLRAADLPVGVRKTPRGALVLTHEGQDMSPEDFVLRLLESYTKELVTD
jgi:hypothetical protein